MVIYTKKGDKGKTGLYIGGVDQKKQVSKSTVKIQALGAIDELNSYLGIIPSHSEDKRLNNIVSDIQKDLLTIGSISGGSDLRFFKSKTKKLERIIDELEKELPPLKNFIVPGGSRVAAHLQYARSLARKAERAVVALNETEKVKPQILVYMNRLSDTLFILAREVNYKMNVDEEVWVGKKSGKSKSHYS
jgi:cob(I)alamin adenosyltransferase